MRERGNKKYVRICKVQLHTTLGAPCTLRGLWFCACTRRQKPGGERVRERERARATRSNSLLAQIMTVRCLRARELFGARASREPHYFFFFLSSLSLSLVSLSSIIFFFYVCFLPFLFSFYNSFARSRSQPASQPTVFRPLFYLYELSAPSSRAHTEPRTTTTT